MAKLTKIFSPNKDKTVLPEGEPPQMPLRIVRAGGIVQSYYMVVPAARVMEMHPRLVLVRPEVFCRPWESVLGPDEILTPGEKLYLVPRSTFRKLRLRLRRPSLRPMTATGHETVGPTRPSGRKRVHFIDMWQLSLVAIAEESTDI